MNQMDWNNHRTGLQQHPQDILPNQNEYFFEQILSHNTNAFYQNSIPFGNISNCPVPYRMDFENSNLMLDSNKSSSDNQSNFSSVSDQDYYISNGNSSEGSLEYTSPSTSAPSPIRYSSYTTKTPSDSGVSRKPSGVTKRSRMGCLTCRSRKKRCCETKPRCQECARLGLNCTWPAPGLEHRNKPRLAKEAEGMHYDAFYGNIKILRGIVENKVNIS